MHKRLLAKLVALPLILGLSLTGCGNKGGEAGGPVVATYTGGQVTQGEFEKQVGLRKLMDPNFQESEQSKREVLEEYILQQKIIVSKAKEMGVKVDDNKAKTTADNYKNQMSQILYGGDQKKFDEQMKKSNVKDEDFRAMIQNLLYVQEYQKKVLEKIQPSDEDLKKYYEEHKSSFATAVVHHILTNTKEEADKVKERLLKGEDFAAVAKEVSIDPSAKQNGGKMEGPLGQYVPPFRDAAMALEIGKLSDPVKTDYGYHIIKVEKRGDPDSFDKVKDTVREQYTGEKMEKEYEDIKKGANIQITLPAEKK